MYNKNYSVLKAQATKLRKSGLSYNEISKKIKVSKSTLSFWLKGIVLKPEQQERLYTKQVIILAKGPRSQKERRSQEIAQIIKKAGEEIAIPISFEAYKLFGAAIYWAEGSKTSSFGFTNSDPYLIIFMTQWLNRVFGISPNTLRAWLNIYEQQNERELKIFWSKATNIPIQNFGKSFIKPSGSGYRKNNLYYGTIKAIAPMGTDKRHQVFGWIKAVLKDIKPTIKVEQREWRAVGKTSRPANILV